MKRLLMIDPKFPTAVKSPNHQTILPVGLLKIGAYYQSMGWDVKLVRLSESEDPPNWNPSKIIITSIFTYWAEYVKDAVDWAREHYPNVPVEVGGVFASLQPKLCKEYTGCDSVYVGVMDEAERYLPNYDLLSFDVDYQILHTSRGCQRRCRPCGVYLCEPRQSFKDTIKGEVFKRKLVFYDNNLLANPYIENILRELILLKRQRVIRSCESQSGFDGRILRKNPHLAKMIKDAGFVYPKIAWDGSVKSWKNREREIDILVDAGYRRQDISVFMLFNHELDFTELEYKRMHCYRWRVQVTPCRYRPLDQLHDHYIGKCKSQTGDKYFIHPNWTDSQIRQFNRNVRQHNASVRYRTLYYSSKVEHKKIGLDLHRKVRKGKYTEVLKYLDDAWNPNEFRSDLNV